MNDNNPFEILRPEQFDPATAKQRLANRKPPKTLHDFELSAEFYKPDDKLTLAINTALAVEAPLLLTGEPGTGKTQVAYYLSRYFDIPVFSYQVRSISTVEDMKYDFDAVGYLHYAEQGDTDEQGRSQQKNRDDFLTKNAMWKAFEYPTLSVLLIDEIDKAPRDFPNDLLQELDQYEFKHPFENRLIKTAHRPIVIITSNAERRLPDAFLRRCVYYYIKLTRELVEAAVRARHQHDFPNLDDAMLANAQDCFWALYEHDFIQKPPSTAELLVWLSVLSARGVTAAELNKDRIDELPAIAALIKDKDDLDRLSDAI
jgi:MoxR-like ATPase